MRRRGKPGDYLFTDDLTGFVTYASKIKRGFYGEMAVTPLKRNLQEIATPLNDPVPVENYRGPQYEIMPDYCLCYSAPLYVGNTTVPTNPNNMAFQVLDLDPGIGEATVGCNLQVH